MKKAKSRQAATRSPDMLSQYDLSGRKGERGKYYRACRDGYTVIIHKANRTVSVQQFMLQKGAVVLDPELRPYFPDSEAVNTVLRGLISLIPRKRKGVGTGRARIAT